MVNISLLSETEFSLSYGTIIFFYLVFHYSLLILQYLTNCLLQVSPVPFISIFSFKDMHSSLCNFLLNFCRMFSMLCLKDAVFPWLHPKRQNNANHVLFCSSFLEYQSLKGFLSPAAWFPSCLGNVKFVLCKLPRWIWNVLLPTIFPSLRKDFSFMFVPTWGTGSISGTPTIEIPYLLFPA